jgi:thiamine monophosphate synthase
MGWERAKKLSMTYILFGSIFGNNQIVDAQRVLGAQGVSHYIAYDTMDPIKILGSHQKNFRAF